MSESTEILEGRYLPYGDEARVRVIVEGLAGSGKSRLAKAILRCLEGEDNIEVSRFLVANGERCVPIYTKQTDA